ncbi:S8 family serine peptidase [Neobacillus bataviensis]|uniref:S8 family serine peptidase n=1 Tax=Neobacillus bataviensis TaxID=220685 RepID=UPI001CC0943C|nr:S8 family serine peptidase [Neobacillus bataviensis]
MTKSKLKALKVMTTAAVTSIILSSFTAFAETSEPSTGSQQAQYTANQTKIDQVLKQLTPEQRRAIQDLTNTETTGLQLSSTTDLTSDQEISVIIEFKNRPAKTAVQIEKYNGRELSLEDAEKSVVEDHTTFKQDLEALKIKGKITRSYTQVYNGVSMTLPANEVKKLLKSKAVKSVWENQTIQLDSTTEIASEGTSAYTGKDPQELMGIDKLHKEGITGKGVKIGVLDTGIDYNHPDLKDAFKGGYDFVDDDNDPMETTYEDWINAGKPENGGRAYYTDHGTHVSGIIAGQQKNDAMYSKLGVAPDADLHVYRVLGPYASGTEENIIAGVEQAVKDKMDIINMSLGNTYNSPLSPISVAVNNAVISGVNAILAAGNSGGAMYTVGSPAASPLAITVGSTNTEVALPGFFGTFNTTNKQIAAEIRYCTTGFGIESRLLKGQTIEVVDANFGTMDDFAKINVKDKIALISTGGGLTVSQMVANAKENGAKAIFIFDKLGSGYITDRLTEIPGYIPAQIMSGAQGKEVKEALKTGPAFFTFNEINEKYMAYDDTISSFSSRGPVLNTYDIKPEVMAPGGTIMSTVSDHYRGKNYLGNYKYAYDKFSGTSMATPHVVGIAALMLQANPKLSPEDVKSTLMNTADTVKGSYTYSVYEVGAGRVDAYEAVHAVSSFEVHDDTFTLNVNDKERKMKEITGALSFGTYFASENDITANKEIEIQNNSSQEQTYEVKVSYQTTRMSNDAVQNGVVLETAPSVTLKAGGKETVSAEIKVPSTAKNGGYEGYVTFTNKDNADDTYQIPFAIRKVTEGVKSINIANTLTTIQGSGGTNVLGGNFSLNSHMKSIDMFLTDAKSGEELGFIGNFDGAWISENTTTSFAFNGNYYPFTDDKKNPISYDTQMAEPGSYNLKFVFTDYQGKETIIEKPFVIDNEMPAIETEMQDGIIEIDPASPTIQIKGKVYDKQIEDAVALGLDVKQGNNRLNYKTGTTPYPMTHTVDQMGNFNYTTTLQNYQQVLPISFYTQDRAGLSSIQKEFIFVKKGMNYISTIPDKKQVKTGDVITFTSKANNSTSWKEAKWNYQFNKDYLAIESVEVPEELKDKVTLVTTETSSGLSVSLKTLSGTIPASATLPLLQVKAKVKEDKFIDTYVNMSVTNAIYTAENGTNTTAVSAHPSVKVWPKYSQINGDMNGEGIYYRDGYGQLLTMYVNYLALGAKVTVKDELGNTYEGKVTADAKFTVNGLPSDRKKLTLQFDVPGHFTIEKSFTIGREGGIGEQRLLSFKSAKAGDVNKDSLIDIDDAVYLKTNWNTSDRSADINFDGIVDMKDMNYIVKNYQLENPTVKPAKTPKENANGKTLEEIISSLK